MKIHTTSQREIREVCENLSNHPTDYLEINETSKFNWDDLDMLKIRWEHMRGGCCYCESVELIASNETTDRYLVINSNKSRFFLNIIKKSKQEFLDSIYALPMFKPQNSNEINSLMQTARSTKNPILYLAFEDEQQNMNITGNQGHHTLSVMSGIRQGLQWHLEDKQYIEELKFPDVLYFTVSKKEKKRIDVYKHFFKKMFRDYFNNEFINDFSDDIYTVYFWKTL